MSIILMDDVKWWKCPHCKKPIKIEIQESESYGCGAWLMKPGFDFADEITRKDLIKKAEKLYEKLAEGYRYE